MSRDYTLSCIKKVSTLIFQRIIEVREKLGFKNQKDFAKALNIPFRTYQSYEQGQVKAIPHTFIEKLHIKYDIPCKWLLFGKGYMFVENDISENYVTSQNGNGNLALNGKQIHININKDDVEIIKYFKKLTTKKQQYYSHLIRADVLKEEMENEAKDIIK